MLTFVEVLTLVLFDVLVALDVFTFVLVAVLTFVLLLVFVDVFVFTLVLLLVLVLVLHSCRPWQIISFTPRDGDTLSNFLGVSCWF